MGRSDLHITDGINDDAKAGHLALELSIVPAHSYHHSDHYSPGAKFQGALAPGLSGLSSGYANCGA